MVTCGARKNRSATDEEIIVPVRVAPVTRGSIEELIEFLGNINAQHQVNVYSLVPTKLVERKVEVGDQVKKNDVLGIVDDTKIQQAVIQAEAGLESAQAQYNNVLAEWERIKKLFEGHAVSQSQYDAVQTQKEAASAAVKQLKAAVAQAKDQLKDTYIVAPISGVVAQRFFDVGDQTVPQLPAFTIAKMDTLKILINIVESDLSKIKVGNPAYIYVTAYSEDQFEGYVSRIDPTVSPLTRTVGAEIVIANPKLKLKPGMFATINLVVRKQENTLLIPRQSMLENTSLEYLGGEVTNTRINVRNYIFVVENNIAKEVEVRTGISDSREVEILDGLAEGDSVVTMGQFSLSNGNKVEVVK
jgi:RND family efflux transporter MFP subunit